jgi:hypothetical protein
VLERHLGDLIPGGQSTTWAQHFKGKNTGTQELLTLPFENVKSFDNQVRQTAQPAASSSSPAP